MFEHLLYLYGGSTGKAMVMPFAAFFAGFSDRCQPFRGKVGEWIANIFHRRETAGFDPDHWRRVFFADHKWITVNMASDFSRSAPTT